MKSVRFYLVCLVSLFTIGCNTPRQYFNRPDFASPVIANGDGTGYRNGELVNTTNMICTEPSEYDDIQTYFSDIEYRLFICLKYNRCK